MTVKTCRACKYSFQEPDDDLVCGHPDSGPFGQYCHRGPVAHCGPDRSKFGQHPLRNPDGTLGVTPEEPQASPPESGA